MALASEPEEDPPSPDDDSTPGEAPHIAEAHFEQVPATHEGAGTPLTFRLVFSEAPNVSYRTLRDIALQATNG